ncbi:hypothetical protein BJ944DRAFT_247468 [Cunninghamella echinulata]|nr:hypothetical protein BJ944DRAFT_247468 [Cunninghamella echinulata]
MTYLTYPIHPPPFSPNIQSQQYNIRHDDDTNNNKHSTRNGKWKRNPYSRLKMIVLSLNIIYMIRAFDGVLTHGSIALHEHYNSYKLTSSIFHLFLNSVVLIALVIDIIIFTTKKVSIANSIWRPGVFFFMFIISEQFIGLMNKILNHEHFSDICQQSIDAFIPENLMVMVCEQQLQIEHISSFLFLCRDLIACSIYVIALHYYMPYLVKKLEKDQQEDIVDLNSIRSSENN